VSGSIAERVDAIFRDCLYDEEEMTDMEDGVPIGAIIVDGILNKYGLHPDRVAWHKEEIRTLLNQMPKQFHAGGGGGWSFLNLCVTEDGTQWGEHRNMEQLGVLAIAADMGFYCYPRDVWKVFPGGMPYVAFNTGSRNAP
jgi:hypothetical protein